MYSGDGSGESDLEIEFDEDGHLIEATHESPFCSTDDNEVPRRSAPDVENAAASASEWTPTNSSPHSSRYRVLTKERVADLGKAMVTDTIEVTGMDWNTAEYLLCKMYRWRPNHLAQDWLESPSRVVNRAKLPESLVTIYGSADSSCDGQPTPTKQQPPNPTSQSSSSLERNNKESDILPFASDSAPAPPSSLFTCPITTEVVPFEDSKALGCGHRFSDICWRRYLLSAMEEGPEAVLDKRCPSYKCGWLVSSDFWAQYLPTHLLEKYEIFKVTNYVDFNAALRWCPSPTCNKVIEYAGDESQGTSWGDICCSCGSKFCFFCLDEPHSPIPCKTIFAWRQKNLNEADNITWILANTKNCPACKNPIQKNQGCMHMTCRCRHQFCWLCLGDWSKHNTSSMYHCNVFESRSSIAGEEEMKKAKESLERYSHFFERYRAHNHGQIFASEQTLATVRNHMDTISSKFEKLADVDFFEEAALQIIECRRMLKWSYAFGYFADWSRCPQNKHLFEDHQGQLEKTLDTLTELIENFSITKLTYGTMGDVYTFKSRLTNLTRVVRGFFQKMGEAFESEFVSLANGD